MFMTGTETIHSSKRNLLLDVKQKMGYTSKGTPNKTCFYVFRDGAATIHGKMFPVQFQTKTQCFGHLPLFPLLRDNGGRENL
jgi:hypothetical protein